MGGNIYFRPEIWQERKRNRHATFSSQSQPLVVIPERTPRELQNLRKIQQNESAYSFKESALSVLAEAV